MSLLRASLGLGVRGGVAAPERDRVHDHVVAPQGDAAHPRADEEEDRFVAPLAVGHLGVPVVDGVEPLVRTEAARAEQRQAEHAGEKCLLHVFGLLLFVGRGKARHAPLSAHFYTGREGALPPPAPQRSIGVIFTFRNWIRAPSDCRQIWPGMGSHQLALFCSAPLTTRRSSPPSRTISYVFHSPIGSSFEGASLAVRRPSVRTGSTCIGKASMFQMSPALRCCSWASMLAGQTLSGPWRRISTPELPGGWPGTWRHSSVSAKLVYSFSVRR